MGGGGEAMGTMLAASSCSAILVPVMIDKVASMRNNY